jgi:hypothetical protein
MEENKMSGVEYSLIFKNNSTNNGYACVFQQHPDQKEKNLMSLAWFSKFAHTTTVLEFKWTIDYSFVWSRTGKLKAGVLFTASQNWDADLSSKNKITLTYESQAFTFKDQCSGPGEGSLYIYEDGSIPKDMGSVGIGMGGSGTFVQQAQPNWNLEFIPHPQYWIAFGNYLPGEVLDVQSMSNTKQVPYANSIYSMTAMLDENNKWHISPTDAVNEAYLNAQGSGKEVEWGGVYK